MLGGTLAPYGTLAPNSANCSCVGYAGIRSITTDLLLLLLFQHATPHTRV